MPEGVTEGALELVVAVLRMAVADYLAREYGHDGVGRPRSIRPHHRADAELFLRGPWADCLSDWINLRPGLVWMEAKARWRHPARLGVTNSVRDA